MEALGNERLVPRRLPPFCCNVNGNSYTPLIPEFWPLKSYLWSPRLVLLFASILYFSTSRQSPYEVPN